MTTCQMVSYFGTDRERINCALHQMRDTLVAGAGSGYGVAHYTDEAVLLNRRPGVEVEGHSFAELLGGVKTRVLIAHTFNGSKEVQARDLHPFKFRSWSFALTGALLQPTVDHKKLREELLKDVPDFIRRNVQGYTCTEALFHHFLWQLHQADQLNPQRQDAKTVAAILRSSVALVQSHLGDAGTLAVNVVATNGHNTYVLRQGAKIAQFLREGIIDCELCYGETGSMDTFTLRESHQRFRGVFLAIDIDEVPEGWTLVEDGAVLVIDGALELKLL